jgi:peroxiredoxin
MSALRGPDFRPHRLLRFRLILLAAPAIFAQPPVPRRAPEISGVHLSSYHGRVVLLAFISTQCSHCQRASQVFEQLSREFGSSLQVVDLAFDDAPDLAGFAKRLGLTYPVSKCSGQEARAFLGLPAEARLATPQVVLIDGAGMIRAQSEPSGSPLLQSADYLRSLIRAILGVTR